MKRDFAVMSKTSRSATAHFYFLSSEPFIGALVCPRLLAISFLLTKGTEFAKYGGEKGLPRYALGIAPVFFAIPTMLFPGQIALASQFAAFSATWFMDQRATQNGWSMF